MGFRLRFVYLSLWFMGGGKLWVVVYGRGGDRGIWMVGKKGKVVYLKELFLELWCFDIGG